MTASTTTDRDGEVAAAARRVRQPPQRIGRREAHWTDLTTLFTDDAVYIDPAWGRVAGKRRAPPTSSTSRSAASRTGTSPSSSPPSPATPSSSSGPAAARHPTRRQPLPAVGHLDARLRRRRQVLLRGGPAQHGPRDRGHRRQRWRPGAGFVPPPANRRPQLRPTRRRYRGSDHASLDDELLNRVTWKIPNALALVGSRPATNATR